ncbi:MAG TPA: hypothetical protein VFN34_05200 [Ornithinibacter sp.]|nr:hypothetical protein [Ornithinibacter sp.]
MGIVDEDDEVGVATSQHHQRTGIRRPEDGPGKRLRVAPVVDGAHHDDSPASGGC